jgi:hypothetical protein
MHWRAVTLLDAVGKKSSDLLSFIAGSVAPAITLSQSIGKIASHGASVPIALTNSEIKGIGSGGGGANALVVFSTAPQVTILSAGRRKCGKLAC